MSVSEKVVELAKRRGFFFVSSEIYGGIAGFYDYGAIGTMLKRKLENLWRKYFLSLDENFFEIETANIMPEKVFDASGHLVNFVDPVAKCKKCGTFHRADHIMEEYLHENFEGKTIEELTKIIKKHNIKCPRCKGELGDVSVLNMMFPISIGTDKETTTAYLRPETAQGAYVNFLRHFNILRMQLPLGLAIIGKAFRNEISPRQLLLRQREFTQAELQIFFDPKKIDEHDKWKEVANYKLILLLSKKLTKLTCNEVVKKLKLPKFYVYYLAKTQQFFLNELKIPENKFRLRQLSEEERAFYNKIHFDVEVQLEIGWKEVGGVHYRGSHDLEGHQKISGQSQEIFYDGRKFIANVLEISCGIDRIFYAILELSYRDNKNREWEWLQLPPKIAPFLVGVFPLVNKDNLPQKAMEIFKMLKNEFDTFYDDSGSIGKRYARSDEIGVPFGITCDHQTLKDSTVTIRFRDNTKQIRVKEKDLIDVLKKQI